MTDNDIFSVLCVPECVICTHMLYVDFEVAETNCETLLPISLTLYLCNADILFLVAHHTQNLSLALFLTFEGIWNQMGPIL